MLGLLSEIATARQDYRLEAHNRSSRKLGSILAVEMKKVADHYDLVGGGHSTAASLSGKMEPSVLANHLVQNLKARLLQK